MMVVCLYFVLLLGISVGESTAQDFSDGPDGSRIVLLTNILTSPTDVEKLYSALVSRGLTNIDLIVPQRASPHSPPVLFSVLSKRKDRTVWQGNINELIVWLSVNKPSTLISVTDNTDVPQILASARKKGLLSVPTLVIWIAKSDASDTNGKNGITLTSPADFDSQPSTFGAQRTMQSIYSNDIESVLVDMLQTKKYNVHNRDRRAAFLSTPSANSSSSLLAFSTSPLLSVQATEQPLSSSMAGTSSVIVVPPENSSPSSSMAGASFASPSALSIKASTLSGVEATPSSSSSSNTVLVTSTAAEAPSASLSTLSVNAGTSSALGASPVNTSPSSSVVATSTAAIASRSSFSSSSVNAGTSSPLLVSSVNTSPSSSMVATSTAAVASSASLSTARNVASTSSVVASLTSSPSSTVDATTSSAAVPPPSLTSQASALATSSSASTSGADTSFTLIAHSDSSSVPSIIVGSTSSEAVASTTSPSPSIAIAGASSTIIATVASLFTSSVVAGTSSSLAVPRTSSLPSSTMVSSSTGAVPSPGSLSPTGAVVSAFSATTAPSTSLSPSSVEVGTTFVSVSPPISSSPSVVTVVTSSSVVVPASGSATSSAAVTASSSFLSVAVGSSSVSSVKVISSFKHVSVLPSSTKIASPSASEFVPGVTIASSVTSASSQADVQYTSESLYFSPSVVSMSLAFSEKTAIVSTSKPSTVSPSPRSSSFSLYSSSVQIGLTSVTIPFTAITSESSRLSTSIITPSSTEGQLSPTSEAITQPPPVSKDETMRMECEGNCKEVLNNPRIKQEFQKGFRREVANKLLINQSYVSVDSIECGSIIVVFTVAGASGKPNVSHVLKEFVNSGNFKVEVNNQTYTAYKIELVLPTLPPSQAPTTKAPKNRITLILYITFGGVIGLIFIVGVIVMVLRCRRDRHERHFSLHVEPNVELRRFPGIPRAGNYSRMNYYGDPVELDATAADPNAPDEFQAREGGYPHNHSSSLDRAQAIATSDNDDNFNVGTMGLPEWKNLPKLSKSEVTVAGGPKQDILKASGLVGSRQHLLDEYNSQEDAQRASDKPTITFSGASGFDEEQDSNHAHDNPAVEDGLPAPEKEVSLD